MEGNRVKSSVDVWRGRDFELPLDKPKIMGILNVTPDSFYDGGRYFSLKQAVLRIEQMIEEGADIIDVGGQSTRPGSDFVPSDVQIERVVPAIKECKKISPSTIVSIDTVNADVARAALDAGASIINDISGFQFDPDLAKVAGEYKCGCVINHIKGTPKDMQKNPTYSDMWAEIKDYLKRGIARLEGAGVKRESMVVDPGIGFGKRLEHNLKILRELKNLEELGLPILVGPSRKAFIGAILDLPPDERLEGTIAAAVIAVLNGAKIVRVHDVKAVKRAITVAWAICNA